MKPAYFWITALMLCLGCASSVTVSKLTLNNYAPTDPEKIEVLKVPPLRRHEQFADIHATQFPVDQSERMYKELREKAASVGADAVLITGEQTFRRDFILYRDVKAVALKWN